MKIDFYNIKKVCSILYTFLRIISLEYFVKEISGIILGKYLRCSGGVGDKADCLKKGPRPIGGMPSMGVFLRDPRKTPNG